MTWMSLDVGLRINSKLPRMEMRQLGDYSRNLNKSLRQWAGQDSEYILTLGSTGFPDILEMEFQKSNVRGVFHDFSMRNWNGRIPII